jgi:ketosteroid isomerase-like protein
MTVDKQETATSWDELPATITTYLTAHRERDVATAVTAFTADAVVTDEGHTYRGRDDIREWLLNAASGFTFTTESSARQHGTRRTSTSCNSWKGTSRAGSPTCTSVSPSMAH